jgi:hypothetical protein
MSTNDSTATTDENLTYDCGRLRAFLRCWVTIMTTRSGAG